jgi:hypothetical protein
MIHRRDAEGAEGKKKKMKEKTLYRYWEGNFRGAERELKRS